MYATPETVVAMNKAQAAALVAAGQVCLDMAQRVAGLNATLAASLGQVVLAALRASSEGRTPQISTTVLENLTTYPRGVLEILQEAQGETMKVLDAGMGQFSREALEATEKALLVSGGVPGSEWVASALRNAMGATVSSVDALQIVFKQFTEASEAAVKASIPSAPALVPVPGKRVA